MRLSTGRIDKWDRQLAKALSLVRSVEQECIGVKLSAKGGRLSDVSRIRTQLSGVCTHIEVVQVSSRELREGEKRRNPKKVTQ